MKLELKNIGVIRNAEIQLNGITLLAGYNGTGKSTVSKALYALTEGYSAMPVIINSAKAGSIAAFLISFLEEACKNWYFSNSQLDKLQPFCTMIAEGKQALPTRLDEWLKVLTERLKDIEIDYETAQNAFPRFIQQVQTALERQDSEYVEFLIGEMLRSVFDGQVTTIGSASVGEIRLSDRNYDIFTQILQNKVIACSTGDCREIQPFYLEPRHVLDDIWRNQQTAEQELAQQAYAFPLSKSDFYLKLKEKASHLPKTIEAYESKERIKESIYSVIHGKLIAENGLLRYQDANYMEPLSLRNVASGIKTFAVIQQLVETQSIDSRSVFIIDEPETNLHPEWQLKLAEVLVLLHKESGIRLLLNTHSTYFFRAMEVYSKQYGVQNRCHYYKTEPAKDAENMFSVVNVDGETKKVYHEFYMPFEEL